MKEKRRILLSVLKVKFLKIEYIFDIIILKRIICKDKSDIFMRNTDHDYHQRHRQS